MKTQTPTPQLSREEEKLFDEQFMMSGFIKPELQLRDGGQQLMRQVKVFLAQSNQRAVEAERARIKRCLFPVIDIKDDHICAAGEKKKTVFPEIIEGKDPDLIWRDGGMYVGVINRGDTIVMYTWDGIAESWITRNVFDRVDLFVKEF